MTDVRVGQTRMCRFNDKPYKITGHLSGEGFTIDFPGEKTGIRGFFFSPKASLRTDCFTTHLILTRPRRKV